MFPNIEKKESHVASKMLFGSKFSVFDPKECPLEIVWFLKKNKIKNIKVRTLKKQKLINKIVLLTKKNQIQRKDYKNIIKSRISHFLGKYLEVKVARVVINTFPSILPTYI